MNNQNRNDNDECKIASSNGKTSETCIKTQNRKKLKKEVYLPGQKIENGEELIPDESTYILYHSAQTGSPCLSFDIIPDALGDNRNEFPVTLYLVAGTQANKANANKIIVMKMSNLQETQKEKNKDSDDDNSNSESDSDDESDDDPDMKPELKVAAIMHSGGVNRIRFTKLGNTHIAATWSDRKSVQIWNLDKQIEAVDNANILSELKKDYDNSVVPPLFTFTGHSDEGFALDWSNTVSGNLLSGDCKSNIHLWKMKNDGSWLVDHNPFSAHTDSVEDIQWSPNEESVFASCSVDKTVRIWDIRAKPSKACMLTKHAHNADVNVLNWNRMDPFIVTGGDDGWIKVWDLRQFDKEKSVARFKHHNGPITSVEWHKTDSSVFAASGADDQITQWDLGVELDSQSDDCIADIPPQLLFIHQGQKDIKEIHWHKQIPGLLISTALDGFNVFKTISV